MFRPNNHLFARTVTPATREFAKGFSVQPGSYPQIGHDVWIGANVTLSAGITIGTGAVIASGALVTKDVAPYEIVGGNPAKPIRKRFSDSMVEDLLASKWWEYEPSQLFTEDPRDLSAVLARIERGELDPYVPRTITLGA
ncbi:MULTISPECIES: CatB-related O-acetyltransferase [unclassified Leucobacter]|uniref:CatB-related O-acetyltransferase n=1 Tax=unclassified Leucobacter TaxID=2621730 RepID=UPI001BFDFC9B|nr:MULTISPECIES: CatB-related O-acetyltransferase [unclassified Leucobacter]